MVVIYENFYVTKIEYIISKVQGEDSAFFTVTLLTWLYRRVDIVLSCGKKGSTALFHSEGKIWANKTSLTPFNFLLTYLYKGEDSEWSYT